MKCVTPNLKSEQYGVALNAVPLPLSNGGRVVACPVISMLFFSTNQMLGVISDLDNDRFRNLPVA
jgi:hypothetical protein